MPQHSLRSKSATGIFPSLIVHGFPLRPKSSTNETFVSYELIMYFGPMHSGLMCQISLRKLNNLLVSCYSMTRSSPGPVHFSEIEDLFLPIYLGSMVNVSSVPRVPGPSL
ncbi:hypothetical protein PDIG_81520 [Penicillium digitatum PHI26]|uniref:Uncharacterized protein n=2 Tax=Penicillium digitatum TaxID=36651 RepID=K9F969_PEND2|nr:hypothetical protein PDIP_29880 [Penicillium digitatum Pd1]EKV05955.1 hypothetical protein PDIG_81520 [Penicillium digitatum PHI26]EKV17791.1 hypothetical protein PDIP_29880 [Penicillium digitatum Pd1]